MNTQKFPNIGDKLFLMHREVIVIRFYSLFRFVTVRYLEETKEFSVDICALSYKPDYTNSISLSVFGGDNRE